METQEPKRNAGNRQPRRKGQKGPTPWRQDPVIMQRVNLVRTLWARKSTVAQMLPVVNALMVKLGVPEITEDTIWEDRKRIRILLAEETQDSDAAMEAHIESFREIQRAAWAAFQSTKDSSLNRSAMLGVLRQTEADIAKLDGSWVDSKKTAIGFDSTLLDIIKSLANEEDA